MRSVQIHCSFHFHFVVVLRDPCLEGVLHGAANGLASLRAACACASCLCSRCFCVCFFFLCAYCKFLRVVFYFLKCVHIDSPAFVSLLHWHLCFEAILRRVSSQYIELNRIIFSSKRQTITSPNVHNSCEARTYKHKCHSTRNSAFDAALLP